MNLEREVIVDLLPAYFSGEASAATRALVEEYFREHPDFEASARRAGGPLESLRVPALTADKEKEKLALERARLVVETRSSFLWMAILFTLLLFLFRIQDHKIIWGLWTKPLSGIIFSAMAAFFWLLYLYTRKRKDPVPARVKFLWMAIFYTLLPFLFTVQNHRVVWLFKKDPDVAVIMGGVALVLWLLYLYHRRMAKRTSC
jgi:hypothetical protein